MAVSGHPNGNSVSKLSGLPPEEIIFGHSAAMFPIRQKVQKILGTEVPILIQGENGTGKGLLVQYIHSRSAFSSGAFVKVNCAAIPGALLESELFGYEKGAFTGAHASKPGRVELAHNGTLFLDEIADLSLGLQSKLLQFLQDGRFSRIGDESERVVEVRLICATTKNLEEEIDKGRFRADLYYRINVVRMRLPQLCERREDIPLLAEYFLIQFQQKFARKTEPLTKKAMRYLQNLDWPGNIRELENCMARCVILGAEDALEVYLHDRRPSSGTAEGEAGGSIPLKRITEKARRQFEQDVILKTLETHHWNRRKTAEALKISYRTLLYKVREAGFNLNVLTKKIPSAR